MTAAGAVVSIVMLTAAEVALLPAVSTEAVVTDHVPSASAPKVQDPVVPAAV